MTVMFLAMPLRSFRFRLLAASTLMMFSGSNTTDAATITFDFSGTINPGIVVGANTIPTGTPFSGTFSYDSPQTGTTTSYFGGTQTVYSFQSLKLTIGGQTVTENGGQIGLYDNVNPPNSVPVGDSLYTFVPGISNDSPHTSSGSIDGVTPNFIYLGFVDSTGKVFSGSGLPQSVNLASFNEAFLGINYGPSGAGNTTTIFNILHLTTPSGSVPEPSSAALLALGAGGLCLMTRATSKRRTS